MCRQLNHRFECRPESVPRARRTVAGVLDGWGVREDDPARRAVDDLMLVTSELMANAVKSDSDDVELVLTAHRDHLEVAVLDQDPMPARELAAANDDLSGRGVALVAALSSCWGQDSYDGLHKRVWSRIEVPKGSVLAESCRR